MEGFDLFQSKKWNSSIYSTLKSGIVLFDPFKMWEGSISSDNKGGRVLFIPIKIMESFYFIEPEDWNSSISS